MPSDSDPAVPTSVADDASSTVAESTPPTETTPSIESMPDQDLPIEERRSECNARAATAELHYQPEKEMVVGRTDRIEAVAVVGGSGSVAQLEGGEPVEVVDAKLGCVVRAQLQGIGFEISPGEWQDKTFLEANEVRWVWLVSPKSKGTHPLTLEVQSFLLDRDGNRTLSGDLQPIKLDIEVTVDDSWLTSLGRAFSDFWAHPIWGSLAGAAVLGAAAATVWRRLSDRPWPWSPKPSRQT